MKEFRSEINVCLRERWKKSFGETERVFPELDYFIPLEKGKYLPFVRTFPFSGAYYEHDRESIL